MLSAMIGVAVRQARNAQGISRAELAAKGGVSVRLVAEMERGVRPNVSLETAMKLLRALGLTIRLTDHAPQDATLPHDEETARRARAAARRATWVGRLGSRSASTPPAPPRTVAGRLAAVTHASNLVHAVAQGALAATPDTVKPVRPQRTSRRAL